MSYPSTWKKVKFGDIAKRKSVRIDNPQESEYERYVGLEHLDSGELIVKRWGSTKDVTSNMQLFNKDDILFARRNTYLRRISVALFDGVCSGDIIVIEPILDHIVKGFLPIYMQFEEFENRVVAWSAGAFSKRIKWKQLSDFDIWIPPKEEQQKIVDIIWNIHDNQEQIENVIKVIEKIKKAIINQIIGNCKNGEVKKLGDFIQIIKGVSYNSKDYCDKEIGNYFINLACIKKGGGFNWDGIKYFKGEYKPQQVIKEGDILVPNVDITRSADVLGYPIMLPKIDTNKEIIFSMDLSKIKLNDENELNKYYLYYLLQCDDIHDFIVTYAGGSTVLHLRTESVKKIEIKVPDLKEQIKISELLKNVDIFLDKANTNIIKLLNLKKKLINGFLSAEILIPVEVKS